MHLLGQRRRLRNRIADDDRKILWINLTAPSLGDALMDTSGRVLLKGREVHLLTHPKNAELFAGDEIFSRVFTLPEEAREEHQRRHYDLVLVDSFSPRSLRPKIQVDSTLPFVGLYGFLNGFDIHRTFFSYGRLRQLLQQSESLGRRLSIGLAKNVTRAQGPPKAPIRIAVGLGGEWAYRTYEHWGEVVRTLPGDWHIILLGSENGRQVSIEVQRLSHRETLRNLVGLTGLEETCRVLREADLYLGADGGLWHLACACGTPSVALFAKGVSRLRVPDSANCSAIESGGQSVSEISPSVVISAVKVRLTCPSQSAS